MVCDNLICIWAECERSARSARETRRMSKTERCYVKIMVAAFVVLALAYILLLFHLQSDDAYVQCVAYAVISICLVVIRIMSKKLEGSDDASQALEGTKAVYKTALRQFLEETKLEKDKLSTLAEIVESFIHAKLERKEVFVSRAFSVFVGGVAVSGLAFLLQNLESSTPVSIVHVLLICAASATCALITGPLWSALDRRKMDSVEKAQELLACLECRELFGWRFDDADE